MKKLLLAMAFALPMASTNAEFQMRKILVCDERDAILGALSEKFNEVPVWTGHSPSQKTDLVLTENAETGAWTLIEIMDERIVCVLAVGERTSHKIKSRYST
jgi:hypothetical protein